VMLSDVWATGQTVWLVHAVSAEALRQKLDEDPGLLRKLEEKVIDGLGKTLYLNGEQGEIARGISRRHGYEIRIPKDFMVEEDAGNRFVRMKRIQPDEPVSFFLIYYEPSRLSDDDPRLATYCTALRDTLAALYFGGDRVEPSRTRANWVDFQGRRTLEIYGLYQNDNPPMGGPFRSYCFQENGRLYLIDQAVFNPPGKKLPQLRLLEAIARTLRLGPDGAAGPSALVTP